MSKNVKRWIIFRRIIFILFIIFLINYFSVKTGYYETKINEKKILTEEKMQEFESDIKEGKYVDIKDYTESNYVDTTNLLDKVGYNIGEGINDFINTKVISFIKEIGKLFT